MIMTGYCKLRIKTAGLRRMEYSSTHHINRWQNVRSRAGQRFSPFPPYIGMKKGSGMWQLQFQYCAVLQTDKNAGLDGDEAFVYRGRR